MKYPALISYFKLSLDIIYNSKWRNFWTILGIVIGISSVVTIVAVGTGIKNEINYQLTTYQTQNKYVIQPKSITGDGSNNNIVSKLSNISTLSSLNDLDVSALNNLDGLDKYSPFSLLHTTISGTNSSIKNGSVVGTNQYLNNYLNLSLNSGQFIDLPGDPINSAVIGPSLAAKLFGDLSPLGATININNTPFIIQGVLNQINTVPFSQMVDFNKIVIIDYDSAQKLSDNNAFISQIFLTVSRNQPVFLTNLQNKLDRLNGDQNNTYISPISDISINTKSTLDLLTRLIAIIATISLLVAGVGIMNVMLVSVAERTHEIGIRKAIGATNRQIVSQFLMEAIILSFFGGIIGVAVSYIIDLFIVLATSIKPVISWQLVLLSCFVSVIIGVVFGSVPAIKAAKKLPIDSLRSS